jgi:hypothetical protein
VGDLPTARSRICRTAPVSLVCAVAVFMAACVPTGSAPPYDAGAAPAAATTFRPSPNVMTAPFEDSFDRPDAAAESAADAGIPHPADRSVITRDSGVSEGGLGGRESLPPRGDDSGANDGGVLALMLDAGARVERERDAGPGAVLPDRSNLGPNWTQIKTNAWRVENGKLCGQGAHNHPVWLTRTLPVNARIEFDVTGYSDDGDLKAEVWGDGSSYATGTSYTNATSYLTILGGWKNTLHVLARLNEHGTDRKEIRVDKTSDDPTQRPAQKGQTYHFKIERSDGKTIRWSVDGVEFVAWNDPAPLAGQGHDHFGFNEWEAKVCYDNVKVTPL